MTETRILVVDLDGTLVRTDLLHESFWSALAGDWTTPFRAAAALARGGRAGLKAALAARARIDPATLPYDETVLALIRDWRAQGGPETGGPETGRTVALVSASDVRLVEAVAAHLGLFDVVAGSTPGQNLKGQAKAAWIDARFGAGTYAYIGDHKADLPVWQGAARAYSLHARPALRAALDRARARDMGGGASVATHLGQPTAPLRPALRQMRPHQWLKNLLIFVPMLTAHRLELATFAAALAAFVAFSMVASSVYVLNDLLDLGADRQHPRKRLRPLASGRLPIATGTAMAGGLFLGGAALALAIGPMFALVLLAYFALTSAYSLWLKRRLTIDIVALAALYTLRILAGGAATGLPISVWLLAFSMFFFLALAAVKRQAELVDGIAAGKVGAAGRGYLASDLPIVETMGLAAGYVAVLVMAMYISSSAVTALYSAPYMLWGICLVLLYWLSRMVMITHRGRMHDDPVVFAVKDPVSRSCVVMCLAFAVAGAVM